MIYVDTKPGLKEKPEETYATFAHELQHLVNFITAFLIGRVDSENYLIPTDVWVNEGLSAYAEYLYLGKNPVDRWGWLYDDRSTVKTGNKFFVWGNHDDIAIMDDYATVYLFFRWLYLQAGAVTGLQSRIFFDIGNSLHPDYHAVTEVAKEINPLWEDWETLLRTWLAANYYPKNPYGYIDDEELQEVIKIAPISVAGDKISLYPGEGVYSIINNNSFTPAQSDNANPHIRYAGLTAHTNDINTVSPYNENVLLTFNANTDNSKGRGETGSLTGVSPPAASPTADDSRSAAKHTGPYIIDAWDMWGRDQNKFKFPLPQ
jgi:hypothetical protein